MIAATAIEPEYVDSFGAARITGFTVKSLESMRYRGEGPKYHRVGRSIRYRVADLRAWIEGVTS